jgi:hypothetical protein
LLLREVSFVKAIFLVVALAAQSCEHTNLPPPDGPGTCETAAEHLKSLGGCGFDTSKFLAQCHDAENAEKAIGKRFPVGCLTAAKDCKEEMTCK